MTTATCAVARTSRPAGPICGVRQSRPRSRSLPARRSSATGEADAYRTGRPAGISVAPSSTSASHGKASARQASAQTIPARPERASAQPHRRRPDPRGSVSVWWLAAAWFRTRASRDGDLRTRRPLALLIDRDRRAGYVYPVELASRPQWPAFPRSGASWLLGGCHRHIHSRSSSEEPVGGCVEGFPPVSPAHRSFSPS
jgi:hypothetical protein